MRGGQAQRSSEDGSTKRTQKRTSGKTTDTSGAKQSGGRGKAATNRQSSGQSEAQTQNVAGKRSRSNNRDGAQGRSETPSVAPSTSGGATASRRLTVALPSRGASLRVDLQKYVRESYKPNDYLNGIALIFKFEAARGLRDLVSTVLGSRTPFGNMLSEHAMEGLLDKLSDDYRKCKVAERKGIRAVLNWCSGLAQPAKELEGQLLMMVLSGDENATAPPSSTSTEAPEKTTPPSTASSPPTSDTKPPARPNRKNDGGHDLDLDRGIPEQRRRRRRL